MNCHNVVYKVSPIFLLAGEVSNTSSIWLSGAWEIRTLYMWQKDAFILMLKKMIEENLVPGHLNLRIWSLFDVIIYMTFTVFRASSI